MMRLLNCIICGDLVATTPKGQSPWGAEFRALIIGRGDQESSLSGVGDCHIYTYRYTAPVDYNARYNKSSFGSGSSSGSDPGPKILSLDFDDYINRKYFLLHVSCCALLQKYFHPRPIPVARLAEICLSCPVELGRYLSWGHSYGGLLELEIPFPWEEWAIGTGVHGILAAYNRYYDPWDVPQLAKTIESKRLLELQRVKRKWRGKRRRQKPSRAAEKRRRKARAFRAELLAAGDIIPNRLTNLPLEILEYIITFLPTDGVQSLSRASKGLRIIIPGGLGQSFWASRFQIPFECNFAFDAFAYAPGELDWKSLYFAINGARSPAFKARRRVWGIIQSLAGLLDLKLKGGPTLLPLGDNESELRWEEVHGALKLPEEGQDVTMLQLHEGCLRFYSQRTAIPALLSHITVSTISIENMTFVTGMRFVSDGGPEVSLGYTGGEESSIETTGIRGLVLAVGTRGIHALQLVTPTGQVSSWVGNPGGLLKTRRLAIDKPITAIEAGFDGFKMVSLAVAETPSPSHGGPDEARPLRETALWFPHIPEGHLQLNEDRFADRTKAATGFQPLCCVFGGTTMPRSLSKIVTLQNYNPYQAFECYYDTGHVSRLSPQQPFSRVSNLGATYLVTTTRAAKTKNDGIKFLKVRESLKSHLPSVPPCPVGSCNHYRQTPDRPSILTPTAIASGSTLTGLYARWDNRLASLGVISEFIEEPEDPASGRTGGVEEGSEDLIA